MPIGFARAEENTGDGSHPVGPTDSAPVLGIWHNCDKGGSGGILSMSVERRAGRLYAHAFGAGTPVPFDWGEREAQPLATTPTSTEGWAFAVTYDFGFLRTLIRAYVKLGNLVVTTYNSFRDGSGRAPYWTREFFYLIHVPLGELHASAVPPTDTLTRSRDRLDPIGTTPPTLDLAPLVGTWLNFNVDSTGICRADVTMGGPPMVRLFGSADTGPHDWGTVEAEPLSADVASHESDAFVAGYDLGYAQVSAVAYFQRRLLTIDAGTTYVDGSGRADYFTRAHFYNP